MDGICARCKTEVKGRVFRTAISLMRHGRTLMNEKHLIIGSIDDPLSDVGRGQALQTAGGLKHSKTPNLIVTGPMARQKETGSIIGKSLDISIQIDPRLRERCVGEFEGKPEFEGMLKKFLTEEVPAPGAEPLSEFTHRVLTSLKTASSLMGRGLLITSALPLVVMVCEVRGWKLTDAAEFPVPGNCEPIHFKVMEPCWKCGSIYYEDDLP